MIARVVLGVIHIGERMHEIYSKIFLIFKLLLIFVGVVLICLAWGDYVKRSKPLTFLEFFLAPIYYKGNEKALNFWGAVLMMVGLLML